MVIKRFNGEVSLSSRGRRTEEINRFVYTMSKTIYDDQRDRGNSLIDDAFFLSTFIPFEQSIVFESCPFLPRVFE